MAKIDDGGQAFPFSDGAHYERGMTLRDHFAGQAMQAMVSQDHEVCYEPSKCDEDFSPDPAGRWFRNPENGCWYTSKAEQGRERPPHKMVTSYEHRLARDAYRQADAMLAERTKGAK